MRGHAWHLWNKCGDNQWRQQWGRFSSSLFGKPLWWRSGQLACPEVSQIRLAEQAIDLFIDRSDEIRGPVLRIRYDGGIAEEDGEGIGFEIAGGIENLQIQYGIDSSDPADNITDTWCNDPFAVLSECNLGFVRRKTSRG